MINSQVYRKLWLAVAAAGLLVVTGCSKEPATQATNQPANKAAAAPKKAATPKPVSVSSKVTQPPQVITVPKGTAITATMAQTLATDKNHSGDSFAARVSKPVQVDGKVVIPKGARITGRVVTVKKRELKLALASVEVHGKSYDLETNSIRPSEKKPAQNNAKDNTKDSSAAKDTKDKKDVTTLPAQTQLTFKLAKPITLSAKG